MDSIRKEKNILKIIKLFPPIIILLSSIFITTYISLEHNTNFKNQKETIKNKFIKENQNKIKVNINGISKLIEDKTINYDKNLRINLKEKIDTAHKIAMNIYNKNKNILTRKEIIFHIKNSLEVISLSGSQGYFSLHTMKGINILQPSTREYEGTSVLNRKDSTGKYPVREAIQIAKTKGEGFMTWYSKKPEDKTKQYKKLGIVKKFEPYNLIIVTARFYDDYIKELEKETITLLKDINFQEKSNLFIINNKGDFLLTKSKSSNIKYIPKDNSFVKAYYDLVKSKEKITYISYESEEERNKYLKISYLKKVAPFNWIIGTGFNYDKLNALIKEKQKELDEEYNKSLYLTLLTAVVVTLVFLIVSLYLSQLIQKMFFDYKKKLIKQETLKFESIMDELNLILDNLPMMMVLKDTKDNIIRVNKTFANTVGLSVKELRNVPTKDVFPIDYEKYYQDDLEVIQTKKEKLGILENITIPNKIKIVETNKIPIFDKNGNVKNIVAFLIDVTETLALKKDNQKKETLLYQQSKMATMGEMIANIAHQWKQPLSTITVAATGTKLQKEMNSLSDESLIYALESINNSAQYLSQTIDDFRNFFNPNSNNFLEFKISSPINKTLKLLLPKFKVQNIEVIQNIEDVEIISLENEIIQVLINILNNARDELIKYKHRKLIFIKIYKEEDSLIIEIKDNAKGINKDIIEKIFDPYFTTKESNDGTGIGLYMSKNILTKLLNAEIIVENETFIYEEIKYTGAKFIIRIKAYQ